MHSVLWLRIRALAGGRIEIANPELPVGESVDVPVRRPSDLPHRSAVDILEEVPGQRLFKTPADVESYLNTERASWEH